MAKIQSGQAIDLVTLSKAEAKVGDYKWSALPSTEFDDEHLGLWKLCNGQSCVGTLYQTLTGNVTVPNALADGAFIRQAKVGRGLGSSEVDTTKLPANAFTGSISGSAASAGNHNHSVSGGTYIGTYGTNSINFANSTVQNYSYTNNDGAHTHSVSGSATVNGGGDAETRPKNIALNLYVKVGY